MTDSAPDSRPSPVVRLFLVFAFAYFLSALLRAVTATLAPVFSTELGLTSADLGLLAGAYFLGFAALQLPLGKALDRFGPRRVLLALLTLAVLGCVGFALARSLPLLIAARALIGVGVGACLMAPLTCFRHRFSATTQLRANSWMLMTGSLGMLASTLPVQWLLPHWGWRGLFAALALLLLLALALIATLVPADTPTARTGNADDSGYWQIVRHPRFASMAPLAFFNYGGMIAVQALWAGPWLTQVCGWSAASAAQGLFAINLCMLLAFMGWGLVMPRLVQRGLDAEALIRWGLPLSLGLLALNLALGPQATAGHWALWCVSSTFVSLSQPAVGQAFPAAQAGRALSAFNLMIFAGVFCLQWGIGLGIDALVATGLPRLQAYRWTFAAFGLCCAGAYLWFLLPRRAVNNRPQA